MGRRLEKVRKRGGVRERERGDFVLIFQATSRAAAACRDELKTRNRRTNWQTVWRGRWHLHNFPILRE